MIAIARELPMTFTMGDSRSLSLSLASSLFFCFSFFSRVHIRPRVLAAAAAVISRIGVERTARGNDATGYADKFGRNIKCRKIRAIRRHDDDDGAVPNAVVSKSACFTTRELLSRLTHTFAAT